MLEASYISFESVDMFACLNSIAASIAALTLWTIPQSKPEKTMLQAFDVTCYFNVHVTLKYATQKELNTY